MSVTSSPSPVTPELGESLGRLHYLDTQAAELYAQSRRRLGPEAPGWLFEVEGRHRNRAARVAQYLRNHLTQPTADSRAHAAIAVLQQELAAELAVQGTITLLRQLEQDLAALADQVMDSRPDWDDEDSWLSLAAPKDEPLSRVEEECQHLPPVNGSRTTLSTENLPHN